MGSGSYYTFAQAAERLQRSKRSLHHYVQNGRLRKIIVDGAPSLEKEDVESLREEMLLESPTVNKKTIKTLQIEIQKLQMKVALLERIAEVRDKPIREEPASVLELYLAADAYFKADANKWGFKAIEHWMDLFERMDETFFDNVRKISNNNQPWMPFFELCLAMLRFAQQVEPQSLTMQAITNRLSLARTHLRRVILIWFTLYPPPNDPSRGGLKGLEDVLLRRLALEPANREDPSA